MPTGIEEAWPTVVYLVHEDGGQQCPSAEQLKWKVRKEIFEIVEMYIRKREIERHM